MLAILDLVMIILKLFVWVLIAQAILSWLISFGVINHSNQFVSTIWRMTHQLTEPLLKPVRRFVPPMGGMDLSPIVLILGVYFLQSVIVRYLYPAFAQAGL